MRIASKRFLRGLLAFAAAVSAAALMSVLNVSALSVSAGETDITAAPGDIAEIAIYIGDNPGIGGVELTLGWDGDILQPGSAVPGEFVETTGLGGFNLIIQPPVANNPQTLAFNRLPALDNSDAAGRLATVRIAVPDSAADGAAAEIRLTDVFSIVASAAGGSSEIPLPDIIIALTVTAGGGGTLPPVAAPVTLAASSDLPAGEAARGESFGVTVSLASTHPDNYPTFRFGTMPLRVSIPSGLALTGWNVPNAELNAVAYSSWIPGSEPLTGGYMFINFITGAADFVSPAADMVLLSLDFEAAGGAGIGHIYDVTVDFATTQLGVVRPQLPTARDGTVLQINSYAAAGVLIVPAGELSLAPAAVSISNNNLEAAVSVSRHSGEDYYISLDAADLPPEVTAALNPDQTAIIITGSIPAAGESPVIESAVLSVNLYSGTTVAVLGIRIRLIPALRLEPPEIMISNIGNPDPDNLTAAVTVHGGSAGHDIVLDAAYAGLPHGVYAAVNQDNRTITVTVTPAAIPGTGEELLDESFNLPVAIGESTGTLVINLVLASPDTDIFFLGDVDGDGEITIADVILIARFLVGHDITPYIRGGAPFILYARDAALLTAGSAERGWVRPIDASVLARYLAGHFDDHDEPVFPVNIP